MVQFLNLSFASVFALVHQIRVLAYLLILGLLSDGLKRKRWRLACVPGEEGQVNQHYFVYNDSKMMMGYETTFHLLVLHLLILQVQLLFSADDQDLPPTWNGCTPKIARDLGKLQKETLTWLITQLSNKDLHSCGNTEATKVSHITNIPDHGFKLKATAKKEQY